MNVFFSFELDEETDFKIINPDALIFFNKLREFVIQRLKVLEDEINREESAGHKCIVITIPVPDHPYEGFMFLKYSADLTAKMRSSLTQDDINYLHSRISGDLPSLY